MDGELQRAGGASDGLQRTAQELAKRQPQAAVVAGVAHRARQVAFIEAQRPLEYPLEHLCSFLQRLLRLGGQRGIYLCIQRVRIGGRTCTEEGCCSAGEVVAAHTSASVALSKSGASTASLCRAATGDLLYMGSSSLYQF